jgi:hypothetical protein
VKLLRKCLEKNANRRLHDIADARIEIEDAEVPVAMSLPPGPDQGQGSCLLPFSPLQLAAPFGHYRSRTNSVSKVTPAVKRLQLPLPNSVRETGGSIPTDLAQLSMAMSPDGTRLAYVLQHGNNLQLYLHDLDKQEAVPLAGTLGAFGPFFSFDGRWIGFFAEGKLKKVSVSGGEPIDLCAAANAYGGSWGADGIILVAADEGRRPFKIPETGGIPEAIETDGRGSIRRPDILRVERPRLFQIHWWEWECCRWKPAPSNCWFRTRAAAHTSRTTSFSRVLAYSSHRALIRTNSL